jgi:hypothetical protein
MLGLLKTCIIGVCILIGSMIISRSINHSQPEQPRYQMISHGDEIFILDTQSGDYYSKFNAPDTGPSDWTKVENPFVAE